MADNPVLDMLNEAAERGRRIRQTAEDMEVACRAFNATNPVGATIRVWPGAVGEAAADVQIKEPGAYVLSGHTPVVQVSGGHGCIALSHVALMTVYCGWLRDTAVLDLQVEDRGCGAGSVPCLECQGSGVWAFMEPEIRAQPCAQCKGTGEMLVSI